MTADADWAVKSDADWVSLRPSGGIKNESTIVKVTVQTNSGMEERTAAINIVSGGKAVKTVALTQSLREEGNIDSLFVYIRGTGVDRHIHSDV